MSDAPRYFRVLGGRVIALADDDAIAFQHGATEGRRVGEVRHVRMTGDNASELTADEIDRLKASGAIKADPVREARQVVEAAEDEPLDDVPVVRLAGEDGRVHLFRGRLDPVRRLPAIEAWLEGFFGEKLRVFAVASAAPFNGVIHGTNVFLNTAMETWRCPVLRLGVAAHEAHHSARVDTGPWSREAEDDCDRAAEGAIAAVLGTVDAKVPPVFAKTNVKTCVACYRDGGQRVCRQGEATVGRILTALEAFTH